MAVVASLGDLAHELEFFTKVWWMAVTPQARCLQISCSVAMIGLRIC